MENSFIDPKARIGKNVIIKPFSYIEGNVEIGDNCVIGPHATIYDYVKIGKNCSIFPGAVIGAIPQDLKFHGEESYVEIGDNVMIRECATINRGTAASHKGKTFIDDHTLIMSYCHVAHDCHVGKHCILTSYVGIAGETNVDDWAIIGGASAAHQFTRIGKHAMLSGGSMIGKDVPPYSLAGKRPLSFCGINVVGLKRRGFTAEKIERIRDIYRVLYQGDMIISDAIKKIEDEFPESEEKRDIVDFVKGSKRGIIRYNPYIGSDE
ncbi:MAG: acyl-ACP--UDP-N-acetylglucosamine O-acyltransferase [Bacteroidales bacterium]|jgi:UDP-N-acetylglucosamine acyltransferase|nr:acyl-ACP--UDP-N-acetylglucosamine O-acyltransferase [Bacteroidales bacterium]